MARTRRARARLRARKPRSRPVILEKSRKLFKLWVTYFGAQRARPSSARQSIVLIMEMIFDYLIASLAQKAEKIQSFEILTFCKKVQKFLKFQKFRKISKNFNIFKIVKNSNDCIFFGFLS